MLVDSHCHLDFPEFANDLDGIVARAKAAGIGRIVTISTRVRRQGELLAMFAGGSSGGDGELGQAAATAGAGYLSSLLTSKLGKALPLDLKLNYTRGGSTSSDAVGVSRWITRNLYLEARTHPEARPDENANEGIIEYHLGPFLLQGDAGDRGYAGVDFGGRIDW